MIDGGPARTGRAPDRQALQRAEMLRAQAQQEARPPAEPTRSVAQPSQKSPKPKRGGNGFLAGLAILLLVAILAVAGYFLMTRQSGMVAAEIDEGKYQAVFLSSGQVYFGDLSLVGGDYFKLSGVFYIQSSDTTDEAETDGELPSTTSGMQLIKLGDEVHGPEDAMVIRADQMLFFENLKSDGRVAKLIDQYKQENN